MKAKGTWLLLDCNYLCYRNFYVPGRSQLSFNEIMTGIVYGFLKDIADLQDRFNTQQIVFCFDHGYGLRKTAYPGYKKKRDEKDANLPPDERKAKDEMRRQVEFLKRRYLWEVGYRNVFYQRGYEADDVIASVIHGFKGEDFQAVIVSADKDLFQLLGHRVRMYNPRGSVMTTHKDFITRYGVQPSQWALVKSIAGCTTDEVVGVKGVGEATACKYVNAELKRTSTAHKKILLETPNWIKNLSFVRLPYEGTNTFHLQPDEVSSQNWKNLVDRLGMRSLRNYVPLSGRTARKPLKI